MSISAPQADERRQILDLLAAGKISAEEADELLQALHARGGSGDSTALVVTTPPPRRRPRFLRIVVEEANGRSKVNVRVPMQLIRSGINLARFLPAEVTSEVDGALKNQGMQINLADILTPENVDDLVDSLSDLQIDIGDGGDKVRVFAE